MFTTRESIVSFLEAVCAEFRGPGILYLVGESSLVVEGRRDFCTEVIVAGLVGEDDYPVFCEAVDVAASGVGLTVSIEHPRDVIPLPEGYEDRARVLSDWPDGCDGQLSIRHFDPYSVAVRFVARGDEPDYDLVLAFLEFGWITMKELNAIALDLLPRFSFETIQQDPAEFRRKLKGLQQMWRAHAVE